MITAQGIKKIALEMGACELIHEADSIGSLVSLMGTPQGREFCKVHEFPVLEIFCQHKDELKALNVFVDAGKIAIDDIDNVVIVGETEALIRYTKIDKPYHVMVMHGAKAKVIAYGYSICQIVNVGGEVETHESKNASIFVR